MSAPTPAEQAVLEIESKYDVGDAVPLPPLDGLPGVAAVEAPQPMVLRAVYYDTDALSLLHAGVTLRRRVGGSDPGWHLKLPTAEGRYEVQLPDAEGSPPDRLQAIVRGITRGAALAPVATIETRRAVTRLLDADHELLAEACDDRVEASRPHHPTQSWREWELELKHGGQDLAAAGAAAFASAGAEPSTSGSKLGRVLAAPLEEPAVAPPGKGGCGRDVLGPYLAEQVAELHRLDPLVRADLPDAVHRMRVACRRLRSIFAAYRGLLDRTVTDPLDAELRWLAGVLGEPRDLEIQLTTVAGRIADPPTRHRVEESITAERDDAHRDAIAAMSSARYDALVDRLTELARRPPWTERADRPAAKALRKILRRQLHRVEHRMTAARHTPPGMDRDTRLHGARRAAKRARYAAEAARPVFGKRAKRLASRLSDLQDALGTHHDTVVARARIDRIAEEHPAAADPDVLASLSEEAHHEEKAARHAVAKARKAGRRVR
jgi:CHAD domain-containing protein